MGVCTLIPRSDRPNLEGIDPKFVTAITSKLRTSLDITVTGPYIHDENFWKRKALEEKVGGCFAAVNAEAQWEAEMGELPDCRTWSELETGELSKREIKLASESGCVRAAILRAQPRGRIGELRRVHGHHAETRG